MKPAFSAGTRGVQVASAPKRLAPFWHTALVCGAFFGLVFMPRGFRGAGVSNLTEYLAECVVYALFVLLVFWGLKLGGSSLGDVLGEHWGDQRAPNLVWGLGLALGTIAISVLLHLLLGQPRPARVDVYPQDVGELIAAFLVAGAAGFTEELIFRGYLLRQIYSAKSSLGWAVAWQSVLFVLAHGLNQGAAAVFSKLVMGVLFALVAIRQRSLLPAVVGHISYDVVMFMLAFVLR